VCLHTFLLSAPSLLIYLLSPCSCCNFGFVLLQILGLLKTTFSKMHIIHPNNIPNIFQLGSSVILTICAIKSWMQVVIVTSVLLTVLLFFVQDLLEAIYTSFGQDQAFRRVYKWTKFKQKRSEFVCNLQICLELCELSVSDICNSSQVSTQMSIWGVFQQVS
jgi:hypothetical protein